MSSDATTTPGDDSDPNGRPRDAGHEAVGQALLISIGLAGMLSASLLAEAAVGGLTTVMDALR